MMKYANLTFVQHFRSVGHSILFLVLLSGIATAQAQQTDSDVLQLDKETPAKSVATPDGSSANSDVISVENAVLKIVEEKNIPARSSGVIKKSSIREGSIVLKEQTVMQIDNSESLSEIKKQSKELEMARLDAASQVDLEFAKRSIEVSNAELGRALRSNQRRPGVVAQSEIDQLQLVVKKSIAEKQKTEFQMTMKRMNRDVQEIELELGQLRNDFHQIKSPNAGMIVEVFRRQGEWVEKSESVARVIRLDKLKSEVKVPAALALSNLIGASATFYPTLESEFHQESYKGKVTFIYPEANPISSEVRVWVEIENENMRLIPGLTGRVEIQPAAMRSSSTNTIGKK